jgi:hypothetical protein
MIDSPVHRVYWTEDGCAQFEDFTSDGLGLCLKQCESLRQRRHDGSDIKFISISSEIPECTSLPGVGYNKTEFEWKKRRR